MMIVLPAMMLKGLHWGYTRFYLGWFLKPVDLFTEDEKYRYFHRPNESLTKPIVVQEEKHEEKVEDDGDQDQTAGEKDRKTPKVYGCCNHRHQYVSDFNDFCTILKHISRAYQ